MRVPFQAAEDKQEARLAGDSDLIWLALAAVIFRLSAGLFRGTRPV